ncbi:LysR substrate-binding domain-containing protein [Methylobrevis albus]|uniref:LysR family transcriptional regulator n=1 Tax=Methylobrevis albus TaxID=2793297 RepID=A0A931MXT7_9HYPH|nr:LysR substrate-binding domain-containing protein [Methylobrevis albus]MBH0237325.1 LysR family transcriptional regulator [Methylobrevis albus]
MIDRKWLPLNALRAFDAVGRRLSFTAGAQSLNVTQSALSRHVSSLEELIGKRLLDRRPQGIVLTEAGAKLLPVVTKSFDRIEKVLNELKSDGVERPRVLKVHMPPTFLQRFGLPMLHEFRGEYPNVAVDVSSTYGNGMPARELDVAIIYDRPKISDAINDLLWMQRSTPVCSPALAERFRDRPLEELLNASELLHIRVEGQPADYHWAQFCRHNDVECVTARGITFDTLALAVQYAERGHGVVLADIDMFADEIAAGRLGVPTSLEYKDGFGYFLSLHPEDLDDPLIALFRHWVITRFAGIDRRPSAGRDEEPAGEPGSRPRGWTAV